MSEYQGWENQTQYNDPPEEKAERCPNGLCTPSRIVYTGSGKRDWGSTPSDIQAREMAGQNLVANQPHNGAPNGQVWNGRMWVDQNAVDVDWREVRDLPPGQSHEQLPGADNAQLPAGQSGGVFAWLVGVFSGRKE